MPNGDIQARTASPLDPRYAVYGEIASGGMASVQYGRLLGPRGFTRAVAIKRLHAHFAKEPEFVTMFVDEARLSARLVHANIIHTLDVIETPGEVALVMEYVHGETLWTLLRLARAEQKLIPVPVGCSLLASVLHGLHAAHEATGDNSEPLRIVHRDVSPQNILIGADGIPRVLDFGIAKALGRLRSTPRGEIKGKLGYIAREQLRGEPVDRRTDIYGASAVFWEVLTGRALFDGPSEPAIVHSVLYDAVPAPSSLRPELPLTLDAIVLRGLSRDAEQRFASAREMALAIEREVGLASQSEVEAWLNELAGDRMAERGRLLAALQDTPEVSALPALPSSTRRIERASLPELPVIEDSAPRPVRSRHGRGWLIGAGVAVAAAAAVWLFSTRLPAAHAPQLERAERAAPDDEPERQDVASIDRSPQLQAGGAVDAPAVPFEAPAAAASSKPKRPNTSHALRTARPRPPRERAAQLDDVEAPAPPREPCALFYYIDGKGIRRPKPECL